MADTNFSIGVSSLKNLFEQNSSFKFAIPDYQRPYVWNEEKVEALLKDIAEDISANQEATTYYMGVILIHQKENGLLEIIDGQQRITTLLMFDFIANGESSLINTRKKQLKLNYNSPKSQENIIKNKKFIETTKDTFLTTQQQVELLEKLIFTVIITRSEDDAFVFFDTQNNRGIKLSAVDFLKSYHLKALKGESEEIEKQKLVAKVWDNSNHNQFLDVLFNKYLWRGRSWIGRKVEYENQDKVLFEFQKRTREKPISHTITLFANNKNRLASSIVFSAKKGISICTNAISLNANPKDFPFSFRQPIEKGMSFFLFTEKYNSLYRHIFKTEHEEHTALYELNKFLKDVYEASGFSHYLMDVFKLCVILYYDKFEEDRLFDFGLWLDYLLGAYRIKQKSIVAQTPIKIMRDEQQNLLDIIDRAYLPDEIIDFLQTITPKSYYETEVKGDGVQGKYKTKLKDYYNKSENDSLVEKRNWIYAKRSY